MATNAEQVPLQLLVVDDNPTEVLVMSDAFAELGYLVELNSVKDGREALDYLNQAPPFEDALPVDLIFIDLNMPRVDGFQLLEQIPTGYPAKKVVWTNSTDRADTERALALGADYYATKPGRFAAMVSVLTEIFTTRMRNAPKKPLGSL